MIKFGKIHKNLKMPGFCIVWESNSFYHVRNRKSAPFASQNEQVRGYHQNLDFKLRHIVSLTVHKYAGISSEIRLSYNGYKTWTLLSSRFKNVKSVYPVQPTIHFHSPNTILEPQSENLDFNFDVNWSLTTKKLKMTSTMHEFKLN